MSNDSRAGFTGARQACSASPERKPLEENPRLALDRSGSQTLPTRLPARSGADHGRRRVERARAGDEAEAVRGSEEAARRGFPPRESGGEAAAKEGAGSIPCGPGAEMLPRVDARDEVATWGGRGDHDLRPGRIGRRSETHPGVVVTAPGCSRDRTRVRSSWHRGAVAIAPGCSRHATCQQPRSHPGAVLTTPGCSRHGTWVQSRSHPHALVMAPGCDRHGTWVQLQSHPGVVVTAPGCSLDGTRVLSSRHPRVVDKSEESTSPDGNGGGWLRPTEGAVSVGGGARERVSALPIAARGPQRARQRFVEAEHAALERR